LRNKTFSENLGNEAESKFKGSKSSRDKCEEILTIQTEELGKYSNFIREEDYFI